MLAIFEVMKNWDATHTWDPRPTTNASTRYIGVQQLHMHGMLVSNSLHFLMRDF